jgi:hypothetical protein
MRRIEWMATTRASVVMKNSKLLRVLSLLCSSNQQNSGIWTKRNDPFIVHIQASPVSFFGFPTASACGLASIAS